MMTREIHFILDILIWFLFTKAQSDFYFKWLRIEICIFYNKFILSAI